MSGGGATSVLLKDYPAAQRRQILDLLFKPKFGASMSALLVEVPGDGNSTQGSEPSHQHAKEDVNYSRGYEWWLMLEAKRRNPDLSLDACAWGCPGWVGHGQFWSQDMCDYYVKWIQGLKSVYGLDLDAIGCRNERGVNEDFAKKLRAALNANGLERVRVHGFDNWDKTKFDWTKNLAGDAELRKAVDILSNHTMAEMPASEAVQQLAASLDKPIWNSEEHVYKNGFDCEISLVQAFNNNYIRKIVTWYLAGSVYPMEPYPETPAAMIAHSPWSGHYSIREVLWGYAHYGQFSKIGWHYLNGACGELTNGGTFVTLKSPGHDYSVIAETKNATAAQEVTFRLSGGLSTRKLCVWLEPASIYSLSTTTGQQKGSFPNVPAEKAFSFPYYETFDEYDSPQQWGYLPRYTADIAGVFEIAVRPDNTGQCLRQVIAQKAQSWAPEWMPYTILGDEHWKDYEISADVYLDDGGSAGVMGRVNNVGNGYGCAPKGYYLQISDDGSCALFAATQSTNEPAGHPLAAVTAVHAAGHQWHSVKLQFSSNVITGCVDGARVLSVTNDLYSHGMAGLMTGSHPESRNTALFDNLLINAVGAATPKPTAPAGNPSPIYKP